MPVGLLHARLSYVALLYAVQFRIKAASRAILELERLQQPIVAPQVSMGDTELPAVMSFNASNISGSPAFQWAPGC